MQEYLAKIAEKFKDPQTSEMGYRTDFENFLETIFLKDQKYHIHHDAKSVGGNKPDFVLLKNQVPVLYIENKDIGIDLNKIEKSNQMDRYFGYDNLILTDQVEFRFYRNGEKYGEPIQIATYDKTSRTISPLPENFQRLEKVLLDFTLSYKEPIKRGKHLAQIMGGKAQRIRDNVKEMLASDNEKYTELLNIRKVVTENLVSSLKDEDFADMYAQTLVYGLFAARYNDKTADTFSRAEARDLVPKTNPFLHSFFDHIAGASFPERLRFIVDELCEAFTHADVEKILHDFYKQEKDNKDPIIHFYEDFLKEYDTKKKMEMGVFYTPRPVVQFIVRAVDEILKKEFGLAKGLSDTTKIKVKRKEVYVAQKLNKTESKKDGTLVDVEKEYHKVQVLDVATGTGTFLNEVIEHVHKSFVGQEGRWESYVKSDLLPRLHGFELMMASYTIAHLKLGMTLQETGVRNLNERLGVYLTNTLEEPKDYSNQGSLFGFMDAIADESKNASRIKSEYPIMCVIGNPPYAVSSNNNGEYITELISKYKQNLNERNIQPLSDDYIKFIRFAENLVEKNGEGIVAMITNNSFLDGVIHRQMRKHLLETFNSIYIVNLSSRNQKGDQNVFDIKQGVSINIFIKKDKKDKSLGNVFYAEIIAKRKEKFEILEVGNIEYKKLNYIEPYYFFVPKDFSGAFEYDKGFSISEIFKQQNAGCATGKDEIYVNFTKKGLIENLRNKQFEFNESDISEYNYRIFDKRYFIYDTKIIQRLRDKIMQHFKKENVGLISTKILSSESYQHCFLTNSVGDRCFISNKGKEANYFFPLYLYTKDGEKVQNIDKEIWNKIKEVTGETTPENILDYIYAVLHSPMYREKYKEFLKIDFPRVPYPESKEKFWKLVELGTRLRELHLMTSPESNNLITTFPNGGNDEVEKISYKDEKVSINKDQYFGQVPEVAWNFYIGGYQPAQKYLKDRKGRKLTNDEIEHYQKIIKVLFETDKLMKEIGIVNLS